MPGTVLGAEDRMLRQTRIFQAGREIEERKMNDPGRGNSMCKGQEIKEHKMFKALKTIQNNYNCNCKVGVGDSEV